VRYVWDPFVRICHWSLVAAFTVAFLTHESEWERLTHTKAGYVAGILLISRIIWGFLKTGYARFQSFPPDPEAALKYTWRTMQGRAKPFVGHNPAGSLVIYLMLIAGLSTTISGFLVYNDGWLLDYSDVLHVVHFYSAWGWLILVCGHVLGVITESILHKDNLIVAMFTGVKYDVKESVTPEDEKIVSRETIRIFALFTMPFKWAYHWLCRK
jgi:cytochrome b